MIHWQNIGYILQWDRRSICIVILHVAVSVNLATPIILHKVFRLAVGLQLDIVVVSTFKPY